MARRTIRGLHGKDVWAVVGLVILVGEALAETTMTHAANRARQHPAGRVLIPAGGTYLTLHLSGVIPPQIDPLCVFNCWWRRIPRHELRHM